MPSGRPSAGWVFAGLEIGVSSQHQIIIAKVDKDRAREEEALKTGGVNWGTRGVRYLILTWPLWRRHGRRCSILILLDQTRGLGGLRRVRRLRYK